MNVHDWRMWVPARRPAQVRPEDWYRGYEIRKAEGGGWWVRSWQAGHDEGLHGYTSRSAARAAVREASTAPEAEEETR